MVFMKISIVIPCYNEERRILNTLKSVLEYTKESKNDFEIIVVDDGSKDKTAEIVKSFDSKIKILGGEPNRGKGYAIKRGMLASTGDISLFMDADSSTNISELDNFLPYFRNFDVVIGSRALSSKSVIVPQGIARRTLGKLAHLLIHLVLNTKVKDTTCGFKAFSKRSRLPLFKKQLNLGWGFDYELIFLAEKLGFKIKQVPIKWSNNTDSKVTAKGYLKSLYELFVIRTNNILGKYN